MALRNVDKLARAIAIAEGYQNRDGAVLALAPARRNNPGSLRAALWSSGTVNGYATFDSASDGWRALYRQIALDRDRNLTIQDFIYKWAPPTENRTADYLALVLKETGFKPTDKLGSLIEAFPPSKPVLMAGLPGVVGGPPAAAPGPVLASVFAFPDLGSLPTLEIAAGALLAGIAAIFWLR